MEYTFAIDSEKLPYITASGLKYEVLDALGTSTTFIRLTVKDGSDLIDLIYSGVLYGIDLAMNRPLKESAPLEAKEEVTA